MGKASFQDFRQLLEQVDFVSFDVFDTLIHRRTASPKDVFLLMWANICADEQWAKKSHVCERFPSLRVMAEAEARKEARKRCEHNEEEVSLDDIYVKLASFTGLSKDEVNRLKHLELRTEKQVIYKSSAGWDLYQLAAEAGKHIVFISDMYLPSLEIAQMLKAVGYTSVSSNNLFVSTEHKASKSTGRLFALVSRVTNQNHHKWLHVGDNHHSDVVSPRRLGIRSYHADHAKISNNLNKSNSVNGSVARSIHEAVSQDWKWTCKTQTSSLFTEGYKIFGPLLLGFYGWLRKQLQAQQPDKILFFARDAQLILKMHEVAKVHGCALYNCPYEYVHVSRVALYPLAVTDFPLHRIKQYLFGKSEKSIGELLAIFGLCHSDIHKECAQAHVDVLQSVVSAPRENMEVLFHKLYMKLMRRSACLRGELSEYLKKMIGGALKVAIIDIGWNGSMQASLVRALGYPSHLKIAGYYFGLSEIARINRDNHSQMRGWFMSDGNPRRNQDAIWNGGAEIMEFLMAADHGSTLRYKRDLDGTVQPVLEQLSHEERKYQAAALELQQGALQFFHDHLFLLLSSPNDVFCDLEWAAPFSKLVHDPTRRQAELFGDLTHADSAGSNAARLPLAPKVKLAGALRDPVGVVRCYNRAFWKRGFLRRNVPFI